MPMRSSPRSARREFWGCSPASPIATAGPDYLRAYSTGPWISCPNRLPIRFCLGVAVWYEEAPPPLYSNEKKNELHQSRFVRSGQWYLLPVMGKRMRPITATVPKPLVEDRWLRALIDYGLDRLEKAGVETTCCQCSLSTRPCQRSRSTPQPNPILSSLTSVTRFSIPAAASPRRCRIFDGEPFYIVNSDSFWIEGPRPNLDWLAAGWNAERMDAMLLLASTVRSIGYNGRGDFCMDPAGRLTRRPEREVAPFAYAGAAILHPRLFNDCPQGAVFVEPALRPSN